MTNCLKNLFALASSVEQGRFPHSVIRGWFRNLVSMIRCVANYFAFWAILAMNLQIINDWGNQPQITDCGNLPWLTLCYKICGIARICIILSWMHFKNNLNVGTLYTLITYIFRNKGQSLNYRQFRYFVNNSF